MKVAGLELKTTSATTFDELVAKALPLVKLDSTIKTVEEYSSDLAPPLTFSTSPEADDDPDDKANASKTQWDIYRNSHYKQIFLNHFSVKNLVFRSFHFWFLVTFGDEVTKILRNLCLHFARQDGQDGKKPERKSRN